MEELGTTKRRSSYANSSFPTSPKTGEKWGTPAWGGASRSGRTGASEPHYAYEDEDQSVSWKEPPTNASKAPRYNSIDNIAEFFASRGKKFTLPKVQVEEAKGRRGFRPGQKVRHPKYGEGTVYQREGEGEEAKLTVQFPRFGLKKLVEKYAQLEKA
jgi:DNA helicase-2/ATP-dependent DNA helicase PcrA